MTSKGPKANLSPQVLSIALDITLLSYREVEALAMALEGIWAYNYTAPLAEKLILACEALLASPLTPSEAALDDEIPF